MALIWMSCVIDICEDCIMYEQASNEALKVV